MDEKNSKSKLSSSKPKPKRKLWWLWLLLAVIIVAGIVVIALLLTGVIGGSSESSPGPSPGPRPSPSPGPSPSPRPSPSPSPGPRPSPSPGPRPTPGPSPSPRPTPGPNPGPTPVSIEPENYTQSINCVVSSDNPNCYATSSAITDFTYNQATVSNEPAEVNNNVSNGAAGYDKDAPTAPFTYGIILWKITTSNNETLPKWTLASNPSISNAAENISANTQYLGFVINPTMYQTLFPPAYDNIAVNFKFEVYPTSNKTNTIDVSTTTNNTTITKTYDFSPASNTSQYYLVVYTTTPGINNPVFANQYPMYMRYKPNGTPYAIVDVNNFMVTESVAYTVYFYITDKISDLETIYSSGTITEDENCISYPDHVTVANVAFTEVTQSAAASTSSTIDINCVLNSGLGNCYNNPSSWDYNSTTPTDTGSAYKYDALVFTPSDSSTLSIANVNKTVDGNFIDELSINGTVSSGLCLPDVKGRGVSLQNTSSSPINISLLLEINPSGEDNNCSTSENKGSDPIQWSDVQPNLYYLVVFATNGNYANQFPLYFDSYTTAELGLKVATAYAEASNLVLEDECDLYFCITDSLLDLSTVYTNSSGSWTIDASIVAAPLQVIVKNVKYVNL